MSTAPTTSLLAAVTRLYEAFPYPRYPLLAKPRWQEGYLASSAFAARLAHPHAGGASVVETRGRADILIGGAGEILPYVIRKWEPARHRVTCLDLSRTSLLRARLRLFPVLSPMAFVHGDLARFLEAHPGRFAHIDAYGVLHHMAEPLGAVAALAGALSPGGTARLMVYNAPARAWIRELQRAFALLGLDAYKPDDLATLRTLLKIAGKNLPVLGQRLAQMGPSTLSNDARLVDTFLHAREAQIPVSAWLAAFAAAGLEVKGLFDRYAELDDLPNPLWQPPGIAELAPRAADRRFENNLELLLAKPLINKKSFANGHVSPRFFFKTPPRLWFSYEETRDISLAMRVRLWHAHVRWVQGGVALGKAPWLPMLTSNAKKRLARLGAFMPGQIGDQAIERALVAPMVAKMDAPVIGAPAAISDQLRTAVTRELMARGRMDERRSESVLARFSRAQH